MISPQSRPSVEETRARIFSAAREIFALKGPHGTTTREIAEKAGVNEATLFRHFGNKLALLDAMKGHFCQNRIAHLDTVYASLSGNLESDLLMLGRSMIAGMQANEDLIRVALLEAAADPHADHVPWRMPNVARNYLTTFLAKHVAKGDLLGEPEILARVFMGMFFSYIMGRGFWAESVLTDEMAVDTFVRIFLNGARSGK
ncbi:MAG: TetR/AcrR family transcriptional regulator [Vulcanimicrobiaceae bacterium]